MKMNVVHWLVAMAHLNVTLKLFHIHIYG